MQREGVVQLPVGSVNQYPDLDRRGKGADWQSWVMPNKTPLGGTVPQGLQVGQLERLQQLWRHEAKA